MGEGHGWSGADFHLALHRFLILAKDLQTAARGQLAGVEIQQKSDFPRLKRVPVHLSAEEFADQASESVELEFALLVVVCRGHGKLIGGMGAEL